MISERVLRRGTRIMSFSGQMRRAFAEFFHLAVSGSVVLLIATVLALFLANSTYSANYFEIWETKIGIEIGSFKFSESLLHWINDGLMALFFFVVGLEIKREFIVGELSSLRKATLPVMGALGGMVAPALFYLAINAGGPGNRGWGVPMATDIAFALGVLALLGSRIPIGLKVFLAALAIADDIGAVLVVALFYTAEIHWSWLGIGAILFLLLIAFNILNFRSALLYFVVTVGIWFAFFESGVHATIAGVVAALAIPTQPKRRPVEFAAWGREQIEALERAEVPGMHPLENHPQHVIAEALQHAAQHIQSPLRRLEHALHPVTTFVILPLFALANAGISLSGSRLSEVILQPVSLGIFAGLILGKQLGITLFSFAAVKLKLADWPTGVSLKQLYGASWLGGIGFTMSIFVSGLAFLNPAFVAQAKLAILISSIIAGVAGYLILRATTKPVNVSSPATDG